MTGLPDDLKVELEEAEHCPRCRAGLNKDLYGPVPSWSLKWCERHRTTTAELVARLELALKELHQACRTIPKPEDGDLDGLGGSARINTELVLQHLADAELFMRELVEIHCPERMEELEAIPPYDDLVAPYQADSILPPQRGSVGGKRLIKGD